MLGAVGDLRDMGQSHTVHAGHALHAGEESVLNKESSWVRVYMMCVICWKRKCLYKKKSCCPKHFRFQHKAVVPKSLCNVHQHSTQKTHGSRPHQTAGQRGCLLVKHATGHWHCCLPSCTTSKVHPHQSPHPFPSLGNFESSYFWLEHYQYSSLISLMVSVDVKHHVYFINTWWL